MMLLDERTSGWMKVVYNGTQGLVPANFFRKVEQIAELEVPLPDIPDELDQEVDVHPRAPSDSPIPAVEPAITMIQEVLDDPLIMKRRIEDLRTQLETERGEHQAEMSELMQRLLEYELKYGLQ